MPATPKVSLPAGVLAGHIGDITLPPPYSVQQLIGQLVQVQDDAGNHYLVSETDTHLVLHRRVTPHANGHERNRQEYGPPALAFEKPGDAC